MKNKINYIIHTVGFAEIGNTPTSIKLRSGHYFDLLNPQPEQFTFYDISGALSKICRFGGQCNKFYSVAEHSYHCAALLQDKTNLELIKAVFAHDWTEAFVGDMVKPLKNLIPSFSEIEKNIETVISKKFGINFDEYHTQIKDIDLTLLIAEKNTLFKKDTVSWTWEDRARKVEYTPKLWNPIEAEFHFIQMALELGMDITL